MTHIRWKRWAIAIGVVAAYSAAGFWLVPMVVKQQIPKLGESFLGRQASVGEVNFNPYTLRMEMQDLRLAEADGAPLFSIGELAVELQWRTLIRRAWSFAEIRITEPDVRLTIASDGKFNLGALAESFKSHPKEESADTNLPRLSIGRFLLERGRVEMVDHQAGYSNRFFPLDLALNNFSTLPDRSGTHTFHVDFPGGGQLSWTGETSLNPIRGSGMLILENGSLPELEPYLKSYTDATVASGKFGARLPYRFSYQDGKWDASLADARLTLNALTMNADDVAASIPIKASAGKLQIDFGLAAEQTEGDFKLRLADTVFNVSDLTLAHGKQTPFQLARLGFKAGALDLAARHARIGRLYAQDGHLELTRNRKGQLEIVDLLSRFVVASQKTAASPASPSPDKEPRWTASIDQVDVSGVDAAIMDEATGIKAHVQNIGLQFEDISTDLTQPVKFNAGLSLREGGQLAAQGHVVPSTRAVNIDVQVKQIALSPLQPLLGQYVKLKIADGKVSAQGRLAVNAETTKGASLRYDGSFDVADLMLNEENGERFASWKSVEADKLTASLGPDRLDIPELRIVEPNATLLINEDGSFNAARLLVRSASPDAKAKSSPQTPAQASEVFPVRIQRVRFRNAKLDFSDLSLLPQFGAKIYELNGVITGLSSHRGTRSQIELDGRVDEFGLARIRGGMNAFAPRDNTNIKLAFKNIDMVSASPYSMKFAGYKIAEGKMSLDLGYKVRDGQLEGDNQIVIDNLILGERIDSPDALKLPLELAIAILKDSNGRIDLGLPVYGDMNDPEFSYGAVIWKAIGNVLTKIVSAPFRALAGIFGTGENLETIDFDPGSDRLLPPEREKLKQVAQILAKRTRLKLMVPGQYSEAVDGDALKVRAVRIEIARRAGIKLNVEEPIGPLNLRDRSVRSAMRTLYAERFGDAELDKQKKAAEAAASIEDGKKTVSAQESLSIWERAGKVMDGEPQVADTRPFYRNLLERLHESQPLAAEALIQLGKQRAEVILLALKESGVEAASMSAATPEQVDAEAGKAVGLKLGLTAK